MTYLLKVYKTKNSKTHFITDVVNTELTGYNEVEELLIGEKYYEDSSRTKLLGICRKSEVVNVF